MNHSRRAHPTAYIHQAAAVTAAASRASADSVTRAETAAHSAPESGTAAVALRGECDLRRIANPEIHHLRIVRNLHLLGRGNRKLRPFEPDQLWGIQLYLGDLGCFASYRRNRLMRATASTA